MSTAILSLILVAVSLPHFSPAMRKFVIDEAQLVRDFNERLSSVSIENADGTTEAHTWPGASVRVLASRKGDASAAPLDSEVAFERPAPGSLKISVRPSKTGRPIALIVYVPASIHLSIKGGKDSVTIKGSPMALSVETESGNISFHASGSSNADLSLRSVQGTIESKLPVTTFGPSDAHLLDGRIGRGGSPVILRSARGNINLLSDDDSRIVSIKQSMRIPNATSEQPAEQPGNSSNSSLASSLASKPIDSTAAHSFDNSIKLETRLVNLNVKVVDSAGRPLPNLKKEDFLLFEDTAQQEIYYFEPVTAPLNIVLLLDLSGSTDSKMKIMKKAAKKFVDYLNPSDRIAVAAFTRRFFVISNFTTDHKLLKDRIGDIKNRHGGTAFYDSLWATLDLLDEVKESRKAIVVLTDGVDNSIDHPDDEEYDPKHGFDELLARIQEADASIYPIYLDTEYEVIGRHGRSGHNAYVTARKQLEAVADQTGAIMFKADRAEDLEGVYQQVAAELHSLYSLGYTPKVLHKDNQWRRISIRVNREGVRARTRRGYFAK